ncbi:uncharacterized protein apof [Genypterus blacodes]|uniref:uncharacterized protein apof n=1 Tax=Genypterus blacodes TaxID=154954 RepID=UPI003F76810E
MMHSKLKWLIVVQLLLAEQTLCRVPPPLRNTAPPGNHIQEEGVPIKQGHRSLLKLEGSQPQLGLSSGLRPGPMSAAAQEEERVQSAKHFISVLRAKLQATLQNHLPIQGNISCEELLSASTVDDPLSSMFPQELLSLSLVPVLVVTGCPKEAQTLVLKLYDLLGVRDAEELLMEVEGLIEKRMTKQASIPASAPASASSPQEGLQAEHHIEAVMFNIQQLAMVGDHVMAKGASERCAGWTRVNGSILLGSAEEGALHGLEEAMKACERLGFECAGVTSNGLVKHGKYQAVLKKGSRILPSESPETESWILRCTLEEDFSLFTAAGRRVKRSPQRSCINKKEERVYSVVEWIPAVSTLYNLGTAMYYATVNCTETAKERAILSAVDLGTDALMAVTGGAAGVAGYALGAGVKTGVKAGIKYMLNTMKQDEDLLVNQNSWEDGVITVH